MNQFPYVQGLCGHHENKLKLKNKKNIMKKTLLPAQKRVLIAKDTIKWLDTKAIMTKTNSNYFKMSGKGIKVKNTLRDMELGVMLKNTTNSCQVCAIGGMFYSMVRRFDNITIDVGEHTHHNYLKRIYQSIIFDELERYFSYEQLIMIESAFEMHEMHNPDDWDVDSHEKFIAASKFAISDKKSPAARLRKIMNNIIQNDGVFVL